MAKHSIVVKIADGISNQYAISFTGGFMSRDHVTARVDNEVDGLGDPSYRPITWVNDGIVQVGGDLPENGVEVEFRRTTPIDQPVNDFQNGAVLLDKALDEGFEQAIKRLQEVEDTAGELKVVESVVDDARLARDEAQAAAADAEATVGVITAAADTVATVSAQVAADTSAAATSAGTAASAASSAASNASIAESAADTAVAASERSGVYSALLENYRRTLFRPRLRYNVKADRDVGNHNVLQTFVADTVGRNLYVQHVTGSSPERVVLNRYDLDGPVDQAAQDFQLATTEMRHQSLAIEYTQGAVKLWSSSETDRHLLTRFEYTPGGIPSPEYYQVGDDGSDERVWNVAISANQQIMITQSGNTYRVYDFQAMLKGGPGDYSQAYTREFTVTEGSQGVITDGSFVYVSTGVADASALNSLRVYRLDGVEIGTHTDLTVGLDDALAIGTDCEPEGLFSLVDGSAELLMGIASGVSGSQPGRTNRIYGPSLYIPTDLETDAYLSVLDAMTANPPVAQKRRMRAFIYQAIEKGIWDKFESLWMLKSFDEQSARMDWKNPANALVDNVEYGGTSPVFTPDVGFTGNGTDTVLESTNDVALSEDDMHLAFVNASGAAGALISDLCIGNSSANYLLRGRSTGNKVNVRLGHGTRSPGGTTNTAAADVSAVRDETGSYAYVDGRSYYAGPVSGTAAAGPSGKVYLLGRRTSSSLIEVSNRTMSYASVGSALTRQENATRRNLVNEYLNT